MALLPYSVRQVTQRARGGRRDRDRLDPNAPMPTPDAPPPIAAEGEEGELPEGVSIDAVEELVETEAVVEIVEIVEEG